MNHHILNAKGCALNFVGKRSLIVLSEFPLIIPVTERQVHVINIIYFDYSTLWNLTYDNKLIVAMREIETLAINYIISNGMIENKSQQCNRNYSGKKISLPCFGDKLRRSNSSFHYLLTRLIIVL